MDHLIDEALERQELRRHHGATDANPETAEDLQDLGETGYGARVFHTLLLPEVVARFEIAGWSPAEVAEWRRDRVLGTRFVEQVVKPRVAGYDEFSVERTYRRFAAAARSDSFETRALQLAFSTNPPSDKEVRATERKARLLYERARQGVSFCALVRSYGTVGRDTCGYLQTSSRPPEFAGELRIPERTATGFQIVTTVGPDPLPFESVTEWMNERAFHERIVDERIERRKELRRRARILLNLPTCTIDTAHNIPPPNECADDQ